MRFQFNRSKGPALFVQPWEEFAMKEVSITCFVFLATIAAGAHAEVLDEPTDLDLTGVVKAINFGKTTDQMISGVTFLAAPENSDVAPGVILTLRCDIPGGRGNPPVVAI